MGEVLPNLAVTGLEKGRAEIRSWQLSAPSGKEERVNTTLEDSDQAGDVWSTVNKRELGNQRASTEIPLLYALAH